jgi:hypothetical protein
MLRLVVLIGVIRAGDGCDVGGIINSTREFTTTPSEECVIDTLRSQNGVREVEMSRQGWLTAEIAPPAKEGVDDHFTRVGIGLIRNEKGTPTIQFTAHWWVGERPPAEYRTRLKAFLDVLRDKVIDKCDCENY